MSKLTKKYQGIIMVESKQSNFNAGFDGYPKNYTNAEGENIIFASDKSLKYAMRSHMIMKGYKVFYMQKNTITKEGKIQPMSLNQRYNELFGSTKKSLEVLNNIITMDDIRLFGSAFTYSTPVSFTGPIQIGNGINIDKDTLVITDDITAPFASGEGKNQTTIGNRVFVDEAHYVFPYVINPNVFDGYQDKEYKGFELSDADLEMFIDAAKNGATNLNSCTKFGANNELVVLIELEDEYINFSYDEVSVTRGEHTTITLNIPEKEGTVVKIWAKKGVVVECNREYQSL